LKTKDLGILLGLLKSVSGIRVDGLGLYDSDGEVTPVPQKIIRTLLRSSLHLVSGDHDPAIREALLLANLIVRPARSIEFGQDVATARIGFR
jgi:hypothetical protein